MEEQIRSAEQMVRMFEEDPKLLTKLQKNANPIEVLRDTAEKAEAIIVPEYYKDRTLYRIAVIVLASLALLTALGSIVLVLLDKTTPEVLVSLGSAAAGALVGLFAPSPISK
jgi:hypothetical protein